MQRQGIESDMRWRGGYRVPWPMVVVLVAIAFAIGWFLPPPVPMPPSLPLRLSGYQFISPLLSCNNVKNFPQDKVMAGDIEAAINARKASGDISKASAFFADFTNGRWSTVFPDETYYPSSLGKVPIMLAYFEAAEANPAILDEKITYEPGGTNLNLSQDIPPPRAIVPGESYTVNDLIGYMIKDSDNNAAQLLYANVDRDALRNVYEDLQIPVNDDATISNLDFITPQQISMMFRVLYNATFLTKDDSEKVLRLLSESTFTQGLVAGVPSSTVVAHKLGLVGIAPDGVTTEHELHDCGIVYEPNSPYVLCVMTRGSSDLATMESVIAQISRTVYQDVKNGK